MRMKTLLLVIMMVGVMVNESQGVQVACTHTSSAGDYYDLSPLSICDNSGYTVKAGTDGTITLNVCNSVSSCSPGTAVCQSTNSGDESLGLASQASFTDYSGGKGVTVTYAGGDNNNGCPNATHRSSVFTFICDPSATTPNFTFVQEKPTCTYHFNVESKFACPTTKAPQIQTCPLYVYVVPHTHDDVGWLQTIDGYYSSTVKGILDTVVAALMANSQRRFIYVEQAYFWRWWNDPNTSDQQRANAKTLFNNGQLEFVIGGWVMQDEACTTYGGDIDQMTLGHQFLLNNFGARPTKGWQIDPFGASSVTPTLNKLSGFNAHIIDRVSDKDIYQNEHTMQFNWVGSPSLGSQSSIFTHILDGGINSYCDWFQTFKFDNDPVNSGTIQSWAQQFYSTANEHAANFKTSVLLAEWGCDFAFNNAAPDFHSMDTLITYLQSQESKTNVYVKYATLSEYFEALWAQPNINYPTYTGQDYFPLLESLYWTGYYSSRTELKGLVRQGEATSHIAEQLLTIAKMSIPNVNASAAYTNITLLRLANADAQHHDGVTGTSVPSVVDMYEDDLRSGMTTTLDTVASILSFYISKGQTANAISPSTAALLSLTSGKTVAVLIYNSLGWARSDYVVLPVNLQTLTVTDSNNKTIPSQVNPNHMLNATAKYNLYFQASVPPVGFSTFFVTAGSTGTAEIAKTFEVELGADTLLANGYLTVNVSGSTGLISEVTNEVSKVYATVNQNLRVYTSEHSGAYAFGPSGASQTVASKPPTNTVTTGSLVNEVYQVFATPGTSYAKQNIRLYKSTPNNQQVSGFFEMQYQVGPLPSQHEVVTSFSTSIQNQNNFYTDNNGFEFMQRQRAPSTPTEGNYYPTIYSAFINDANTQLSVFSDRSRGTTSVTNGQLELMIHRNPDMSDGFGPGLTDTDTVLPAARISVDSPAASPIQTRIQPMLLNFPLTPFFASTSSPASWTSTHVTTTQFITGALPPNVHFLSLNPLDGSSAHKSIFRLTHLFAVGEDPVYSKSASIDVGQLFSNFKITSFVETTLTANNVIDTPTTNVVVLNPKQIRTFIVTFA